MKDLRALADDPAKRKPLVDDCVQLVNDEVKSKSGFSGAMVKAAFAMVKAVRPRVLEDSVDGLIDEFVAELQPFYERFQSGGGQGTLETFLRANASEVADRLLTVTDRRAESTRHKTLASAYFKLRPKGKVHVEAATPGIGRVLDGHIKSL